MFEAFVDAGKQAGYEATSDYNGEKQEGFGPMEQTVYKGRRWSTANAYLRPALEHDNCNLMNGLVEKVIIEDGRAMGVALWVERRSPQTAKLSLRPLPSTRPKF